jgi:uncharacterized protein
MVQNLVGWFEIPVRNMVRAMKFYETVFKTKLDRNILGPLDMAWFPWDMKKYGSAGALVRNQKNYKPANGGVLIYFSSKSDNLDKELSRVNKAGGKILREKTQIGKEHGFMALIVDTEGNRIALHSMK